MAGGRKKGEGLFLNESGRPFIRFSGQRPWENSFSLSRPVGTITRFILSARRFDYFRRPRAASFPVTRNKGAAIAEASVLIKLTNSQILTTSGHGTFRENERREKYNKRTMHSMYMPRAP